MNTCNTISTLKIDCGTLVQHMVEGVAPKTIGRQVLAAIGRQLLATIGRQLITAIGVQLIDMQ